MWTADELPVRLRDCPVPTVKYTPRRLLAMWLQYHCSARHIRNEIVLLIKSTPMQPTKTACTGFVKDTGTIGVQGGPKVFTPQNYCYFARAFIAKSQPGNCAVIGRRLSYDLTVVQQCPFYCYYYQHVWTTGLDWATFNVPPNTL